MHFPRECYLLPRAVRKARELVIAENERQRNLLGYSAENDDMHTDGSLAQAGLWYLASVRQMPAVPPAYQKDGAKWPKSWEGSQCKPRNLKRDIVRGLALLMAEHWRVFRIAEGERFKAHPLDVAYCPPSAHQVLETVWTIPDVAKGLNRLTNLLALTPAPATQQAEHAEPVPEILDDCKNPAQ